MKKLTHFWNSHTKQGVMFLHTPSHVPLFYILNLQRVMGMQYVLRIEYVIIMAQNTWTLLH